MADMTHRVKRTPDTAAKLRERKRRAAEHAHMANARRRFSAKLLARVLARNGAGSPGGAV
jgi:hypothetical protein